MNTDYTAKITEIFYSVDEFCKQIEPQFKKKAIGEDGKKSRNRAFKMSDSENYHHSHPLSPLGLPNSGLFCIGRAGVVETISFAEPAHRRKQVLGRPYERDASYRRSDSYLIMYAYTRARSSRFYVFAFTSSPFGDKVLIMCELRVKISPFCLHLFFAIGVVQCVVFQFVAVKVKVKEGLPSPSTG